MADCTSMPTPLWESGMTPSGDATLGDVEAALDTSLMADPAPTVLGTVTYFDPTSGDWVTASPIGAAGIPESFVIDYTTGMPAFKQIGSGFHAEGDGATTVVFDSTLVGGGTTFLPLNATTPAYDDHTAYDAATATYTVPVDGRWEFNSSFYAELAGLQSATADALVTTYLRLNVTSGGVTTTYDLGAQSVPASATSPDAVFAATGGSSPHLDLKAGDTVQANMGVVYDAAVVPGATVTFGNIIPSSFSGTLIA